MAFMVTVALNATRCLRAPRELKRCSDEKRLPEVRLLLKCAASLFVSTADDLVKVD